MNRVRQYLSKQNKWKSFAAIKELDYSRFHEVDCEILFKSLILCRKLVKHSETSRRNYEFKKLRLYARPRLPKDVSPRPFRETYFEYAFKKRASKTKPDASDNLVDGCDVVDCVFCSRDASSGVVQHAEPAREPSSLAVDVSPS